MVSIFKKHTVSRTQQRLVKQVFEGFFFIFGKVTFKSIVLNKILQENIILPTGLPANAAPKKGSKKSLNGSLSPKNSLKMSSGVLKVKSC